LILRLYCSAVLAFLSLPIVVAVGVAFGSDKIARFPPTALSLRWFGVALSNSDLHHRLGNSVVLAALTTLLTIVIGCRGDGPGPPSTPGQPVLETFLLSPLSLPGVLFGVAMLFFLGASGFGLTAWGILAAHVVIAVPYVLRTTLRGLSRPRSRPRGDGRRAGATRGKPSGT